MSESDYSLSKTAPQSKKSDWLKYDRNLSALKDRNSRKQLLFTRPLDIVHTLAHLPATQHKNPETFVIDAWQVPGGTSTTSSSSVSSSRIIPPQLIINVHGELTETRSNTQRYFDRTFILVPSLPGSKSHSSGWPVEIVNDCWTVRPVVDEDAVRRVNNRSRQNMPDVKNLTQQTEMAQLPPVIGKAANLPVVPVSQQLPQQLAQSQQSQSQLTIQQQQYAIELAKLTGLNLEFSVLCLKEHGWQPERALEGFKLARAQNRIPQQAFSTSQ